MMIEEFPSQRIHASEPNEQALLGMILFAGAESNGLSLLNDLEVRLSKDDFFFPKHRRIYSACLDCLKNGIEPDIFAVIDHYGADANSQDQLLQDLTVLCDNTANANHYIQYAESIRAYAHKRRILEFIGKSSQDVHDVHPSELQRIISEIEGGLSKLQHSSNATNDLLHFNSAIESAINDIDRLFSSDGATPGLSTGFPSLDELTGGLHDGNLVVLAGRPSMGKTAIALNMISHALTASDKTVVFFSLEMPDKDIAKRLFASIGGLDMKAVMTGKFKESDWPKLSTAVRKLKDKNFLFDESNPISPNEIRAKIKRKLSETSGIGLIVVDYMQLMNIPGFKEGRVNEISAISRELKAIAKEFNCPVIALSQLNRNLENRTNKRPQNSDLRDSGAIEQDADLILFVYRDIVYNEDTPYPDQAELIIGKQRNGPLGTVNLRFESEYARFVEYQKFNNT